LALSKLFNGLSRCETNYSGAMDIVLVAFGLSNEKYFEVAKLPIA
jgi:hypothetical protein